MLDQELKLDYLKKKSSENKEEELFGQLDRAKHKWERLTHFMLNIDQMQTSMDGMFALNQQIVNMLVEANLLQVNPEFNF
jgi:lipopolysaccharide biosynthesis glycosyltransferase